MKMEILDPTEAFLVVDDDVLNFTLEEQEEEHRETASFSHETQTGSFPEFAEEELEWLSNKDAFPAVETCFGILADNPELVVNHHSPTSVLENSSNSNNSTTTLASCCDSFKVPTNYPVRARSKRRRRRRRSTFVDFPSHLMLTQVNVKIKSQQEPPSLFFVPTPQMPTSGGRRCLHCQSDKTPQWRAGPMGPKTLCNACGVRYKSGRLVPEYRPASSPTFSSALHSNSHRKVVEMRRQKEIGIVGGEGGGVVEVNVQACGYSYNSVG